VSHPGNMRYTRNHRTVQHECDRTMAACAAILLIAASPLAQSRPPELSGLWQLVEPTTAERALDTLAIDAPDQLLITQSPLAIIVEHPSKPGTHPEAGKYTFGTRGYVGGSGGASPGETWDVSFIGTQLMISHSVRGAVARGSMWRLDTPGRLTIEFSEESPGGRPKIAARVYAAASTAPRTPPPGVAP
jgi:hypothetical protein